MTQVKYFPKPFLYVCGTYSEANVKKVFLEQLIRIFMHLTLDELRTVFYYDFL